MNQPMTLQVAIIGAGPSGLMAAQILAEAGMRVTVYDRMPSPGRKLLMAGRGGLNLTHSETLDHFIKRYGEAESWLAPYLHAFTPEMLRAWCETLGEETFVGSSGRIFPRSMKAAPLLRAWLKKLDMLGVKFAMRHEWLGWDNDVLLFRDADHNIIRVTSDAALLALGGASWPRLGSNGSWVRILSERGVGMSELRPANCGFTVNWSEHFRMRFAGEPLKPVMISYAQHTRQGEAIITERGIEGGVIYALSAPLRDAIHTHGTVTVHLDLRPDMTLEALAKKLASPRGNKSLSTYLRKLGFSPLTVGLLRESISAEATRLKSLPITLTGTTGMARAISSAGGIRREALTDTLMLRALPGTFAAGEMLDWEAPTGGYLLQACFSTAYIAAKGMVGYLKGENGAAERNRTSDPVITKNVI
jgi:uncharacterized flavoprotein (TIGR03862 family)